MCDKRIFLSVILPVYNGEKYLKLAIDSILNQTYPYFELIVLNDGSTDSTEEIIKSYKDTRIVYVKKENSGLADTLNVGWRMAKYDWIARMDCDDIAFTNRFEEQVKFLNCNIDIVGAAALTIDENNNEIGQIYLPKSKDEIIRKGKTAFIHPTVIIRKSILKKLGGYDVNFRRTEDLNLWMRYFSIGENIYNIQKKLIYYRKPSNRKTSTIEIIEPFINDYLKQKRYFKQLKKEQYEKIYNWIQKLWTYKLCLFLSLKSNQSLLLMRLYNIVWKICSYYNKTFIYPKNKLL